MPLDDPTPFKLGDRVRIQAPGTTVAPLFGRVIELRGALGQNGLNVYRVRLRRRPKPAYIEVGEDLLQLAPRPAKTRPSATGQPT